VKTLSWTRKRVEIPYGRATVTDERSQGALEVRPGHGSARTL